VRSSGPSAITTAKSSTRKDPILIAVATQRLGTALAGEAAAHDHHAAHRATPV
jgi:hypothetical protein